MSKRPKLPLTEPLGNGEDPPSTEVPVQYIYVAQDAYDQMMRECTFMEDKK